MQGRFQKSFRNIVFGIGGQAITILFSFISRTVFLYCFTQEYVGISSLFTGVFSVLSLADLGMETSMTIHLYKPLESQNKEQIIAHLQYYKKAFYVIAGAIALIGVLLMPFLGCLVKIPENVDNIRLIYLLTLFNTVASYLFVYRQILMIADQKKYITDIVSFLRTIVQFVVMIPVLIVTHSYILYLLIQIIFTMLYNLAVMWKAKKEYPYLSQKEAIRLSDADRKSIRTDMKSMSLHRIGDVVNANVDSVLMAVCVSVIAVAKYSNYHLIINYVKLVMDKIYYALSPSIGNLIAEGNEKKIKETFNRMLFVSMCMVAFCGACLSCLINPFIGIWAGEKYQFSMDNVILLIINFLIINMRKPALIFKEAYGLFNIDRYRPLVESSLNLVLSYSLCRYFDMELAGILLGTIIASLLSSFWVEPFVLYKYGFNMRVSDYFERYIKYAVVIVLVIGTTSFVCLFFPMNISGFVGKIIVCVSLSAFLIWIFTYRMEEFQWAKQIVQKGTTKLFHMKGKRQ